MQNIFRECRAFISLNVSIFDTSLAINMEGIFINCDSLVSLDLSNFDILKVKNTSYMFSGCNSLIFLNLDSFIETKVEEIKVDNMFNNINDNIIFCLNTLNNQNICNAIPSYLFNNNNCRDDYCFSDSIKIDILEKS